MNPGEIDRNLGLSSKSPDLNGKRKIKMRECGRSKRKRQQQNRLLSALALCLVAVLPLTMNVFFSHAKTESTDMAFKYYKSVLVREGDTLWDIVYQNGGVGYQTAEVCIQEIIKVNGMHNDRITAGSYLVVPCYTDRTLER